MASGNHVVKPTELRVASNSRGEEPNIREREGPACRAASGGVEEPLRVAANDGPRHPQANPKYLNDITFLSNRRPA